MKRTISSPRVRRAVSIACGLWVWGTATGWGAGLTLVDFSPPGGPKRIAATGAKASWSDAGSPRLRVETGTRERWPGVAFAAPEGQPWDLTPYADVTVRVRNVGLERVTIFCRVDNTGADGNVHCVTASVSVPAGAEAELPTPLKRTTDDPLDGQLFGLRGYPVRAGGPGTVKPGEITQVLLFLHEPRREHAFEVLAIEARGQYTAPTAWTTDAQPFFPFIDAFGQYRHRGWPGKVLTEADLQQRREAEERDLAAHPGPAGWNPFGGWAEGPKLEATGFFRTAKVAGKWWLVDPEGALFFSHGVDCVFMLDTTPVAGRAAWFADYPGDRSEFARFKSRPYALKGHYAGSSPECFSFAGANLRRKYGSDWERVYPEVIHRRLRSWGVNTIANWSDARVARLRKTPYTDTLNSGHARMIEGSEGYWGKFPDVFDPAFAAGLRAAMERKRGGSAGDPWCIGYFSDNEMSWGDEVSLALAALRSPAEQPAKREFLRDLQSRYDSVVALNRQWGTTHASWEDLAAGREVPDADRARGDLERFYTRCAEQYFRTVREAIRSVAPNQLYLGCRFAWVNPRASAAAAKYCDVVSYNLYQRSVADFVVPGGDDVPLIIGEFHFGALDRGLFHTGLVPVSNQAGRAEAYKQYVLGVLRHPQFVGCHWFQYQDEPTTGRVYDEENYQIGWVDIADTPYPETIAAVREVGRNLYAR